MKKKKKKNNIQEDVIKAMRKANREIELERNGGRWIAVNRPHKNKKKYDRKRDSKVDLESLFLSYFFLFFCGRLKEINQKKKSNN